MPSFTYRALQSNGTVAEGTIEAGGRQEVFRLIEEKGLRPIKVAESRNGKSHSAPAPKAKATEKAP